MIRPQDFEIEIGQSDQGIFVRVTHTRTGKQLVADPVEPDAVGATRDRFLRELRGKLVRPKDIRVDIGLAEGGDFIRVVHRPSGIDRWAMRREGRTEEDLLDEVLEELYARRSEE